MDTAVEVPPIDPNRGRGRSRGRVFDFPGGAPEAVPTTVKGGSISRDFFSSLPGAYPGSFVSSFSPTAVGLSPGFGVGSNSNRESVPLQHAQMAMRLGIHYEFECPGLLLVAFLFIAGESYGS